MCFQSRAENANPALHCMQSPILSVCIRTHMYMQKKKKPKTFIVKGKNDKSPSFNCKCSVYVV